MCAERHTYHDCPPAEDDTYEEIDMTPVTPTTFPCMSTTIGTAKLQTIYLDSCHSSY